ncbi:MAG TPA: hypothetical protein VGF22_01455, partial [Acidimicrobiales bacterium]
FKNHAAQGSAAHVEPLAHRLNDAVTIRVVSDAGAGTAIVIEPLVSGVVGEPTRKLAESAVVVVVGAAGAVGTAGAAVAWSAATVVDESLSRGDASAWPPGATTATVGWFARC